MKLLLKAQENLKLKNSEKTQSFKENTYTQDINVEKKFSARKINFNIQEKAIEKKPTINQDTSSQKIINSFNQDSSRIESKNIANNIKIEEANNNKNNKKKT